MKTFVLRVLLLILGIAIPLLGVEFAERLDHWVRKGTPLLLNPADLWDREIGWLGKESHLGNLKAAPSILVLGDSFTDGLDVPPEKMWFATLSQKYPNQHLIAYGGKGYGNWQEFLILQRYLKIFTPELIVLQLCTNDFLNNSRELEQQSYLQRAPGPRPYFENGASILGFPRQHSWLLLPLISYSRFANKYAMKWEQRNIEQATAKKIHFIEQDIQQYGYGMEAFRKAVSVTEEILKMFRDAAPRSRIVLLLVDDGEPYQSAFRTIAQKLGLQLIVPIHNKKLAAEYYLPDGAHFSELGNEWLGKALVEAIAGDQGKP